jgi:hypothetical protein
VYVWKGAGVGVGDLEFGLVFNLLFVFGFRVWKLAWCLGYGFGVYRGTSPMKKRPPL